MDAQRFWILKGRLTAWPGNDLGHLADERKLLAREGYVLIETGAHGTSVRWVTTAGNWSSLFFAREWIGTYPGPYTLNYFMSGWFSETFADAAQARERVEVLISKSDVLLRSRVYVQAFDPSKAKLGGVLRQAFEQGSGPDNLSVDCDFDALSRQFKVRRLGEDSAISKTFGMSTATYPCRNGGAYDRVISAAYRDVIETGNPHYDQVYAAMIHPDGDTVWMPYHRVIVPRGKPGQAACVSVFSEIRPVSITVV